MLSRILIFLAVIALGHLYLAISFAHDTGFASAAWIFGANFFLILLMPILRVKGEVWRIKRPASALALRAANVLAMSAIGIFAIVFVFSALRDVVLGLSHFWLAPAAYEFAEALSLRLEFMALSLVLIVGFYQAVKGPGIKRVEVPLENLPPEFEGFKIAQISDLHIGPTIREAYVQNVVDAVNALAPDLIAMTGDITDGPPTELAAIAAKLGEMRATHGRFFVTGNHEYYHEALAWIDEHRRAGTQVLINENARVRRGDSELAVLGVPDVTAHHFVAAHRSDPAEAARGVPLETIKVLLAHQPISYKEAEKAGVHLQLSGHTHSGQFFPFNLVIGFFHDFYRGLARFRGMWIYVNPGTGYWGPPLRAAVSSEITLLTLVRSA